MFIQSSYFIEHEGLDTMNRVTFYGQEKAVTTIRLAKMNLAIRSIDGRIAHGDTFHNDRHPDSRLTTSSPTRHSTFPTEMTSMPVTDCPDALASNDLT
jgi:type I restriction-modification system DNA methylase subunit